MSDPKCPQCKGAGCYYRLPPGMNPFAASIEVTARNMRRINCYCVAIERERAAGHEETVK